MTLIDQIRDMIAEGETEKSLEELYAYVKENNADIIDQLVMLRNRNRNLQRSVQMGTMDAQDAALERAKINESILKLLPQLTPEYLAQASRRLEMPAAVPSVRTAEPAEAAPARKSFMPYLIGGGAVLLLLVLVALFSGGGEESAPSTTVTEAQPESADEAAPAASGSSSTKPQSQSDQQEQTTGNTTETTDDDLLSQVLAAHSGHAVWESGNGRMHFEIDPQTGTAQEYGQNGEATFSFQVQSVDANYITLYDASRHMRLRIGESDALFRYDSDSEWKRMAVGRWVTPE